VHKNIGREAFQFFSLFFVEKETEILLERKTTEQLRTRTPQNNIEGNKTNRNNITYKKKKNYPIYQDTQLSSRTIRLRGNNF
jgi:hypothetical protein